MDLHLDNIMFDHNQNIKIIDYGLVIDLEHVRRGCFVSDYVYGWNSYDKTYLRGISHFLRLSCFDFIQQLHVMNENNTINAKICSYFEAYLLNIHD